MLACDMALYDKQDGWLIHSKQNGVFPAHDVASQKTKKKTYADSAGISGSMCLSQ